VCFLTVKSWHQVLIRPTIRGLVWCLFQLSNCKQARYLIVIHVLSRYKKDQIRKSRFTLTIKKNVIRTEFNTLTHEIFWFKPNLSINSFLWDNFAKKKGQDSLNLCDLFHMIWEISRSLNQIWPVIHFLKFQTISLLTAVGVFIFGLSHNFVYWLKNSHVKLYHVNSCQKRKKI
jgi:hypothetical protein